jgi:hypothetical protein
VKKGMYFVTVECKLINVHKVMESMDIKLANENLMTIGLYILFQTNSSQTTYELQIC